MRKEVAILKIYIKNENGHTMGLCCGENEYTLNPDEEISVEVKDGDCIYLDEIQESRGIY